MSLAREAAKNGETLAPAADTTALTQPDMAGETTSEIASTVDDSQVFSDMPESAPQDDADTENLRPEDVFKD